MLLQVRGGHSVPADYPVPKTRSKALYLGLDSLRHIEGGAVGHVAVSIYNMLATIRSCTVKKAWLS